MFDVGKIVNTHGIRGEVKVQRITDFEERFHVGSTLYFVKNQEPPLKLTVASHRKHKSFDLLQFENLAEINDVEDFKNGMLKIKKEQLHELPKGEYYHHEIIGCVIYTTTGELLGVITEILSPGANDVWVIKQEKGRDILIPFIDEVVKKVDINEKKVTMKWMEGLLD